MQAFFSSDSAIVVTMIVGYIAFTSWLTYVLRSKTSAQFMTGRFPPRVCRRFILGHRDAADCQGCKRRYPGVERTEKGTPLGS